MSQPCAPTEILAAAHLIERWRQAIEIEVSAHPAARDLLNGAHSDLCVARDTLNACAQAVEHYLAVRPALPDPRPPCNPVEAPLPFAHLRASPAPHDY